MPLEPTESAPTPAPWNGPNRKARNRQALAAVVAGIVLAVVAVTVIWFLRGSRTDPPQAAPLTTSTSTQPSGTMNRSAPPAIDRSQQKPPAASPTATEVTPTVTSPAARLGLGAEKAYTTFHTDRGYGGTYNRVATLTDTTSEEFMKAVARAYRDSHASGTPLVLEGVYSPVTGKSYRVACAPQPDGASICTAGVNARILLFN